MPFHDCIEVLREEEKLMYRIMKEIEREGESIASSNNPEWKKVSGKLSHKNDLVEQNLIFPILKPHQHSKKSDMRIIKIPKNVEVCEVIRGKKSFFPLKFKKK